jgi:mannonate dehydratase
MTGYVHDAPSAPIPPPWDGEGSGTRITAVRTFVTSVGGPALVVVRVETNQPGLYGLGCATFTQRALAVRTAIEEYLAPQVIGRDPADITDISNGLYVSSYWRGGPVLNNAISGIDEALWDIKGKQAGMPVWQLLGGRARAAVPVYAHASGRDIEELKDNVRAHLSDGYRYIRVQMAIPGSATYGSAQAPGTSPVSWHTVSPNAWEPLLYTRVVPKMLAQLREEFGENIEFLHDVHSRLAPIQAVQLAKDLEQFKLFFLEDLFAPEDTEWLRMVRQQCATPMAIGELFTDYSEFVPLMRERLLDFVRMHISDIGGLTPAWRVASACELLGIRTAWHGPPDLTPIGHAANLALDLAAPAFGIQERYTTNALAAEMFPGAPEVNDAHNRAWFTPGWGVDFDESIAAANPPPEPVSHDAWARIREASGAVQRP